MANITATDKKRKSASYGSDVNDKALQMLREDAARKRQQVLAPLTQKKNAALDAYQNREDFQYDFNADALYHHYKDQYTRQGKAAMEDTMGQAAALTGGYGSSYAQNVGQQAYDAQLQNLNNVIPELYQMAYSQYQDRGNDLLRQYSLAAEEEAQAYARLNQQEQDAVADHKWQTNFAYQQAQDSIANALAQAKNQKTNTEPVSYDNGSVSKGNVKTMQRILGLPETGYWGSAAYKAAGSKTAEEAWADYQKGYLQQRYSPKTNPFIPAEDSGSQGITVQPHTENTRKFMDSMPEDATFDGSDDEYYNYIAHQLDQATWLTDDELLTLAAHYGFLRDYEQAKGW